MRERFLIKVLAISLIFILTIADVLILGTNIAIAVYEELELQSTVTNVADVEFDSYFKEGDKKLHSVNGDTSCEMNLYFNIKVKNAGVLNDAKITIENANFEVIEDKISNSFVASINGNEIFFNQIVYGNEVEVEVPVKFTKSARISLDYFGRESQINLFRKI